MLQSYANNLQKLANVHVYFSSNFGADKNGHNMNSLFDVSGKVAVVTGGSGIIRKSKFPQNPKRSVRFSGKRTKRSVQKRKARNTQKAETKVL